MDLARRVRSGARRARDLARDVRYRLGLDAHFYRGARGRRIVNYHGLCERGPLKFNTLFLTRATFEAHLRFFRAHFHVVTLDEYYRGAFDPDRFNVCLTFDDGFANNFRYALPLLEKYRLPATFFVTAVSEAGGDILWNDFLCLAGRYGPAEIALDGERHRKNRAGKYVSVRTGRSLNERLREEGFTPKAEAMALLDPLAPFRRSRIDSDYWLQMTGDQIAALAASPYATIGSHGYYHNDLSRIGAEAAAAELADSKRYLERVTARSVAAIAFPYGAYDDAVVRAAKQAGYAQLLATDFNDPGDHADPAMRERMTVNPYLSVNNQMAAIVTGSYA